MTNEQLTNFAEELFPEMARFIDGEPTLEKVEQAFWQAMERRQQVAAYYREDADFRESIHEAMFESARKEMGA